MLGSAINIVLGTSASHIELPGFKGFKSCVCSRFILSANVHLRDHIQLTHIGPATYVRVPDSVPNP